MPKSIQREYYAELRGPRRHELDCKRQTVRSRAEFCHGSRVVVRQLKLRRRRACTFDEQSDRRHYRQLIE